MILQRYLIYACLYVTGGIVSDTILDLNPLSNHFTTNVPFIKLDNVLQLIDELRLWGFPGEGARCFAQFLHRHLSSFNLYGNTKWDQVTCTSQSEFSLLRYTLRCRFNADNFLPNPHKIHSIARPLGWRAGCSFVIWHWFIFCFIKIRLFTLFPI